MSKRTLNAYLQHGHQLVKGWLEPGAAQAITLLSKEQQKANLSGPVAEIGVHHGKLFILLYLLSSKKELAVAIDLFSHQDLNVEGSGAGDLERFKRNLNRHADTSRLVIHEGDSTKLTAKRLLELGHGPFRFISIDGGHTAEITAHDLATADGAIRGGGGGSSSSTTVSTRRGQVCRRALIAISPSRDPSFPLASARARHFSVTANSPNDTPQFCARWIPKQ